MNDKTKVVLGLVGATIGGGFIGWSLRGVKENKKFKNFNSATATVLSLYKGGHQFDESMTEFLKLKGFDDRYMFR